MHQYQRSSLGNWLQGSGVGDFTQSQAQTAADAYSGGLIGDLYKTVGDIDDATGGVLGQAQQAALYPSKMIAQAILGNTEAGKDWLTFFDDNFMISGQKRARDAESAAGQLNDGSTAPQTGYKRRKTDAQDPSSLAREVNTNKIMKERLGSVFVPPPGLKNVANNGMSRVPNKTTPGAQLKLIHDSYARLQSY